ncbi:thiol-activated cytolysin family protein [Pedobacter sp. 22226]|uniref:thiol-activated cytolysin family protein n=1 Tax=Pedobacter sp. 22226 TaxID=3453894 RepID=UPI003F84B4E9
MKKYILFMACFAILASCRKNETTLIPQSTFSGKFADPVIDINIEGSSSAYTSQSIKNILDQKKLSGADIYKDSLWANDFGRTLFVETDEIALMKNSAYERYIYAASLLQGNSIADLNFTPISEFQSSVKPVTASVSFQAKRVSGVITNPSLSATRNFVTNILAQNDIGSQVAGFSYSLEKFSAYDELKLAFGSNVKTGTLFGRKTSNSTETIDKISKRTGIYAKFIQKNFTLDLDIPADGKLMNDNVDLNALNQKTPTYVSSITYGRMGIMAIESDYSYEAVNNAYNSAFKALFVSGSSSTTEEEKRIIDESSMKIYIIGADGSDAVETVNGFDAFVQFIIKGGSFSSSNPGVPIYFSLSHLNDHTVVKTKFRINIDTQPIYARIEYQNKQSRYIASQYQTGGESRTTADIYLCFYSDMTGSTPTVPQDNVKFEYNIRQETSLSSSGPYGPSEYQPPMVTNNAIIKSNNFKENRILLKQDAILISDTNLSSSYYDEHDGATYTNSSSNFQKNDYTLNLGIFYKVLAPIL